MDEAQLIGRFLREKSRLSRSLDQVTVKHYKRVMQFWHDLATSKQNSIQNLTREQLKEIMEDMITKEFAITSIINYYSILGSYFTYLIEEEKVCEHNPLLNLKFPRHPEMPGIYLFEEEWRDLIRQLKHTLKPDQPDYYQELMIFIIAIVTGVRCIEESRLRIDSFDQKNNILTVVGKGNKKREIAYSSRLLIELLPKLLQERECRKEKLLSQLKVQVEKHPGKTEKYERRIRNLEQQQSLFLNLWGRPLAIRQIQRRVHKYCSLFGIQKKITPHKFRHTFAALEYQKGVSIYTIQHRLGHSSISTTERYLKFNVSKSKMEIEKIKPFEMDDSELSDLIK